MLKISTRGKDKMGLYRIVFKESSAKTGFMDMKIGFARMKPEKIFTKSHYFSTKPQYFFTKLQSFSGKIEYKKALFADGSTLRYFVHAMPRLGKSTKDFARNRLFFTSAVAVMISKKKEFGFSLCPFPHLCRGKPLRRNGDWKPELLSVSKGLEQQ
jgi:hypothetical protein